MAKVVVTGASGFVGSHVADELSANGYDVILCDKVVSPYKKENQLFAEVDILDKESLCNLFKDVDYVYHFGGIANIEYANKNPHLALEVNMMGTLNVIEACLKNHVKRLFFASSAYVYSELGGFYSCSKKACENMIENYSKFYGLEYTILRYGSLYGSRTSEENGLYRLVKGIMENNEYHYSGTGEEIREYIHILDAAKISVQCISEEYKNECLVLTGIERFRMKDLIEMIKEISMKSTEVKYAGGKGALHYSITPYNYIPKVGRKIVNNPYIDIGQGIIEIIDNITKQK